MPASYIRQTRIFIREQEVRSNQCIDKGKLLKFNYSLSSIHVVLKPSEQAKSSTRPRIAKKTTKRSPSTDLLSLEPLTLPFSQAGKQTRRSHRRPTLPFLSLECGCSNSARIPLEASWIRKAKDQEARRAKIDFVHVHRTLPLTNRSGLNPQMQPRQAHMGKQTYNNVIQAQKQGDGTTHAWVQGTREIAPASMSTTSPVSQPTHPRHLSVSTREAKARVPFAS